MLMTIVIGPADPRRGEVEGFIERIYLEGYGATIPSLPINPIAHFDAEDGIACAVGLRAAADRFFSATCLDAPIETALAASVAVKSSAPKRDQRCSLSRWIAVNRCFSAAARSRAGEGNALVKRAVPHRPEKPLRRRATGSDESVTVFCYDWRGENYVIF
jgi:hypothetical protein